MHTHPRLQLDLHGNFLSMFTIHGNPGIVVGLNSIIEPALRLEILLKPEESRENQNPKQHVIMSEKYIVCSRASEKNKEHFFKLVKTDFTKMKSCMKKSASYFYQQI